MPDAKTICTELENFTQLGETILSVAGNLPIHTCTIACEPRSMLLYAQTLVDKLQSIKLDI
jgi:hypothetical protein